MVAEDIWDEIRRNRNLDASNERWDSLDRLINIELGAEIVSQKQRARWRRAFLDTLHPFFFDEELHRSAFSSDTSDGVDVRKVVKKAAAAEARRRIRRRGESTLTEVALWAGLLPAPWLSSRWFDNHRPPRETLVLLAGLLLVHMVMRATMSRLITGRRRIFMALVWSVLVLAVPCALLLRDRKPPVLVEVLLDALLAMDCAILLLAVVLPLHARLVERADPVEQLVVRMIRLFKAAHAVDLHRGPIPARHQRFPTSTLRHRMVMVRQLEQAARDLHHRFLHADTNRLCLPVKDVQLHAALHARAQTVADTLRSFKIQFVMPPADGLNPILIRLADLFHAACLQNWAEFEHSTIENAPALPWWRRALPKAILAVGLSGAVFALPPLLELAGGEKAALQAPLLLAAAFGLISPASSTIDSTRSALSSALSTFLR